MSRGKIESTVGVSTRSGSATGSTYVAKRGSDVRRWFSTSGRDPLLVLQRASGERPEAADALATFLDTDSLELAATIQRLIDGSQPKTRRARPSRHMGFSSWYVCCAARMRHARAITDWASTPRGAVAAASQPFSNVSGLADVRMMPSFRPVVFRFR